MRAMRSVVANRVGEPSEVLNLQTRPIPEPGPGQVRIRVTAVPVEASDLDTIRGRYGFTPEFPTVDEDLRERVADIAGHDGVSKAIDCVSGRVGADVSRALAPHGELIVYGALSTHRQTDPDKLTIPIFARSLIYQTKTVRGFWLFRWFTETPKDRMGATINRTVQLADSGALRVPEGQPIPVEKFSEAVYLAEAPAHGGKPLLAFEP